MVFIVGCLILKEVGRICTMLDQRRRRWADIVQMLCKCFVFAVSSLSRIPGCYVHIRNQ